MRSVGCRVGAPFPNPVVDAGITQSNRVFGANEYRGLTNN